MKSSKCGIIEAGCTFVGDSGVNVATAYNAKVDFTERMRGFPP